MAVTTDAQQLRHCPHPAEHARSEKIKRRKGKRASTVVVVGLCRSVRRRSIISQRWSPFCAIVVLQQVTVKLFEVLNRARAVMMRAGLVCVCLLLQDLLQSCARGGGGEWRTCAMRYDEPRLVWTRLTTTH